MQPWHLVATTMGCALVVAACMGPARPAPPRSGATCEQSCGVLAAHGCPEAATTRKGTTCVAMCERVMASGYATLPVECIAGQTSVSGVRSCGVRCLQ